MLLTSGAEQKLLVPGLEVVSTAWTLPAVVISYNCSYLIKILVTNVILMLFYRGAVGTCKVRDVHL